MPTPPRHLAKRSGALAFVLVSLALPALAAASGGGLERALEAVTVEGLRRDLAWIASDERGGRDTPSAGLEATAQYLRARLVELGFQAGSSEGFFYEYPLAHRELDAGRSYLEVRGGGEPRRLAFGVDYFIGRSSELGDWSVQAPAVWLGDGSDQDVDASDLAGKWAVVRDGAGSARKTGERARERGAVGLVLLEGAGGKPYAERFARISASLVRSSAGRPSERSRSGDDFPKVFVSAPAGRAIVGSADPAVGGVLGVTIAEERRLTSPGGRAFLKNVCGFWPGRDPELREEVIVLSAHYDHIGEREGEVYNGADDNGSGTAGLLALAGALEAYGPMRRSILLMWVSGEEKGLLGSEAWTRRPWLPGECFPVANINIDMIGRNRPDDLLITPTSDLAGEYNGLTRLAESLCGSEGFGGLRSADEYWNRSDQKNFAQHLGLPVAFLFADVHEDYHGPDDTADKIDYDKVRRVTRLVLRILDGLQTGELRLHERAIPSQAEFCARVARASAERDLERLRRGVESFRSRNAGRYPDSLAVLVVRDEDGATLLGVEELPRDPWGNEYVYVAPGPEEEAIYSSYGSDGAPGGEGPAADVVLD